MGEATLDDAADLRCSTYSRRHHVDPIGTAGSYAGYLLLEWPLPWPADLAAIPALAPLAALAGERGWRLQGLVADERAPSRTVIAYEAPPGPFRAFIRREMVVPAREAVQAATALLDAPAPPPAATPPSAATPGGHDVLVCSHGARDRCCGSLGTRLAERLAERVAGSGAGATASVRVWRTSHTGGHRFAPTAIILPEGTMWGYLGLEVLESILRRDVPAAEVLTGYRGCSGLPARELQALERAVLAELGWQVLEAARSGSVVRPAGSPVDAWSEATLELEWEDGHHLAYTAEVGVARRMQIPDCGAPLEASRKVEHELGLRGMHRLA